MQTADISVKRKTGACVRSTERKAPEAGRIRCRSPAAEIGRPMMYEELVSHLRECSKIDTVENTYKEAADAIERLKCFNALWQEAAKIAHEREPKWIPVTKRLPKERLNPNTKDFEYVLCATIWGDVRPFKFGSMIGFEEPHFWHGSGSMDEYVTHWMPLPEPPKEET